MMTLSVPPITSGGWSLYCLLPIANMLAAGSWTLATFLDKWPTIAHQWWGLTLVVVFGRVAYLAWLHDFRISMIWFVKLVTDPFTDIKAYAPRSAREWRTFSRPMGRIRRARSTERVFALSGRTGNQRSRTDLSAVPVSDTVARCSTL